MINRNFDLNPIELFAAQYFSPLLTAPVPKAHREIYAALYDDSLTRIVIEGFRGLAKSSIACRIYPAYLICETQVPEVQLLSASGGPTGIATKWMQLMQREFEENSLLKHDYQFRRGDHWGQDHLQVIRADGSRCDFYSRGKGASVRGSRGSVIVDDPQDIRDMRSEAVLKSDEAWLFDDVLPVLLKDQRLIFIGTGMSPLSLLSKIKKLPGYTYLGFPAEHPVGSGKSVWPQQFPDEFLEFRRNEIGMDAYNAEYLLRPLVPGNPVFREEWFAKYEPDSAAYREVLRNNHYIVTAIDPAESKNSQADYTAIVTVLATHGSDPDVYVLNAENNHWTTKEAVDQLFVVKDKYDQNKTIVESRCKEPNEDAIITEIKDKEKLYSTSLNLKQVKPIHDKVMRAHKVQGLVQRKKVHFNYADRKQLELMTQMQMFTGEGTFHDDLVDAIVYALTEVKEWAKRFQSGAPKKIQMRYRDDTGEPIIEEI
ncbi:MAG: hypothetical protein AB1690_02490 [Candidatus Zixiibacteriota bacterium]